MATEQFPDDDYIVGTATADSIIGGVGYDHLCGAAGNDTLDGGVSDDALEGGDGNDLLIGGTGNDLLYGGGGQDTLDGGLGDDVYIWTVGMSGKYGSETEGDSVIVDAGGDDDLRLMFTDDAIGFVRTNDDLLLTADGKTLTIKNYFVTGEIGGHIELILVKCNRMDLQYVLDHLPPTTPGEEPTPPKVPGASTPGEEPIPPKVPGTAPEANGNGTPGERPADDLVGRNIAISAPAHFKSATGRDTFNGTAAADVFQFVGTKTVGVGKKSDVIFGFERGNDQIDLSGIDANTATKADNAFRGILSGSKAFTKAGQLRYDAKTGILSGNTDKDAAAEFQIVLKNKPSLLTHHDFVL